MMEPGSFFGLDLLSYRNLVVLFIATTIGSCENKPAVNDNSEKSNTLIENNSPVPADGPPGMVWIPGGEFIMGAIEGDTQARADEYPAHRVRVSGYWMDATEVTNAQFAEFVAATNYITVAEKAPDWEVLKAQVPPGTPKPHDSVLVAASMVFTPVATDNLADWAQWWSWVKDAHWRQPQGEGSSIEDKMNHPAVQISWEDAQAYLEWAGKRFPTEAEWEFAARGGLVNKLYPWGEGRDITVCGNTWQGKFPEHNSQDDGYFTTAPVKSYAPNGYGLYDMAGNVWEWTSDWYNTGYYEECANAGILTDPQGAAQPYDPRQPYMPQRVQRGGSFLCNESYCSSYRASARMQSSPDTGQDHVGFRGVMTQEMWDAVKASGKK